MSTTSDYIEVCEKAVRRGGQVLLDRIGRVQVREKGRADLVTEADFASQEAVRQLLAEEFPDHALVGEEDSPVKTNSVQTKSDFCWIVDPLDGTTNYVHQVPFFAVSLALEHRGELLVGAIFDPNSGECFTAVRGGGAFCNGRRLRTSAVEALPDALVAVGFATVVTAESPDLLLFDEVVKLCQAMRRTGSAALNLAYVAAGRFDACWTYATKVWDLAAGVLLVREAGGVATDFTGQGPSLPHSGPIACLAGANRSVHAEMLAAARRIGVDTAPPG